MDLKFGYCHRAELKGLLEVLNVGETSNNLTKADEERL